MSGRFLAGNVVVPGPAGKLEAIYKPGDSERTTPRFGAVVCHAHPLHGGTMHFKLIFRIARAFDEARAANGPISFLIVNAGIGDSAPFGRTTREAWDRIIATNLSAAFDCSQLALPDLLAGEDSRLVFIASVAGLKGAAYAAPYAASKHGLIGLMRSLAVEFATSNMTVNAICPSFVDTPMVDDSAARIASVSKRSPDEARQSLAAMNRHGKLIHPDGVATMILSICLPQSRDVNGAALTIDGGTSA